eukprot:6186362-Prymnesium_polylepis.1
MSRVYWYWEKEPAVYTGRQHILRERSCCTMAHTDHHRATARGTIPRGWTASDAREAAWDASPAASPRARLEL